MTNCPNCGAPIAGSVCEYCGTRVCIPASYPPVVCETLTIYTIDGETYQIELDGDFNCER